MALQATRKKPRGTREAFQAGTAPLGTAGDVDLVGITVEDLASVLVRFDNGARGAFSVGQVCGGHKNDLVLEVCGSAASIRWRQELVVHERVGADDDHAHVARRRLRTRGRRLALRRGLPTRR